jgi:FG-GAP-like repeat/FG-GAP repeat
MRSITASHRLLFLALSVTLAFVASCVESSSYTPVPPSIPAARLPMNDAYVGSVHAGPLRPLFRWEPSTAQASGTISYELQLSPDSTFETSVTSISTTETTYQPDADLPVSLTPPVGTRYFWRLRSCLRSSCSDYSRPRYVNLGRVIKDYNGDGYSDLAVGAPGNDSYLTNAGRGFVYFGGPGRTMDETADVVIGGFGDLSLESNAGKTIHPAGDINGDGFADLILTIPLLESRGILTGNVYVYYGAAGSSFDGKADSQLATTVARDGFGANAGALGDVNGDGFGDIFVVTQGGTAKSRVDVFFGNPSIGIDAKSDGTLTKAISSFLSVGGSGDVNGDGFADVLVGSPLEMVGGFDSGSAFLYLGSADKGFDIEPDVTFVGRGVNERFGNEVSISGDANGDGFSEVMVASLKLENFDQPGTVDVFLGNSTDISLVPPSTLRGVGGYDQFGTSLEWLGDVDGDGFDDFLVGASHTSVVKDAAGRAYLFKGGAGSSFKSTPAILFDGNVAGNYLGERVAGGDFNGDGFHDVAVGSDESDQSTGKVDIFLSDRGEFGTAPSAIVRGSAPGDKFGEGLAQRSQGPSLRRHSHLARKVGSRRENRCPRLTRRFIVPSSQMAYSRSHLSHGTARRE